MYAIVEIAGQQFKVQKDQKIFVHRLAAEAGSNVEFDKVLLVDNGGKISLGAPAINGAKVTATVNEHVKGDKIGNLRCLTRPRVEVEAGVAALY